MQDSGRGETPARVVAIRSKRAQATVGGLGLHPRSCGPAHALSSRSTWPSPSLIVGIFECHGQSIRDVVRTRYMCGPPNCKTFPRLLTSRRAPSFCLIYDNPWYRHGSEEPKLLATRNRIATGLHFNKSLCIFDGNSCSSFQHSTFLALSKPVPPV